MADKIPINYEHVTNPNLLIKLLDAMYTEITALRTAANELKTDMSAHTHTVTHAACSAGSAAYGSSTPITSAAGATISAATVTQQAVKGK